MFNYIRVFVYILFYLCVPYSLAQENNTLAQIDADRSIFFDLSDTEIEIKLYMSKPVPYRIFALNTPERIVFDFKGIDLAAFSYDQVLKTQKIHSIRRGTYKKDWARMVIRLKAPMVVKDADMRIASDTGGGVFSVKFIDAKPDVFTAQPVLRKTAAWDLPVPANISYAQPPKNGERPIVIVLDPGHGGVDSGARRQGYQEKNLVLKFAEEFRDVLNVTQRYKVHLTREDDSFVSLPERLSRARTAGADVFISLHADALETGWATGTTVYSLSELESQRASNAFVLRQDRSNLISGVNLNGHSDDIAAVLMGMARSETNILSAHFAENVVTNLAQSAGNPRKKPHLKAGFAVLKAPDIPSVLIELGFMSSSRDLENLLSPDWRMSVMNGLVSALDQWLLETAENTQILRR